MRARVSIPRLGTTLDVEFLVDSGADFSLLSGGEASALDVDVVEVADGVRIGGSAGHMKYNMEPTTLAFLGNHRAYVYRTPVLIAPAEPQFAHIHSLLGRDILNRWDMSYRPTRGRLSFDVVSADEIRRFE